MRLLRAILPTDLSYYVRGGGLLLLSQALDLTIGLLTLYVFTNWADRTTFGVYSYLLAVFAVASLATLPGVDTAIQHSAARGQRGALAHGTRTRLRASWVGSVGMALWAAFLWLRGESWVAIPVLAGAVLLPFVYGMTGYRSFLVGQGRFAKYLLVTLVSEMGKLLALAVALRLLSSSSAVIAFFAAISCLNAALTLWIARGVRREPVDAIFSDISNRLTLAAVVGSLAGHIDRLIAGTFYGMSSMADYGFSVSITDPLRNLGGVANRLLFPKMVRTNKASPVFRRKLATGLALAAGGLSLVVLAYNALAPVLVARFFPLYVTAIPMVRLLAVATCLTVWSIIASQALWAFGVRTVFFMQIALPLLNIAVVGSGAALGGFNGILWGRLAYRVLSSVIIAVVLFALCWRAARQGNPRSSHATIGTQREGPR